MLSASTKSRSTTQQSTVPLKYQGGLTLLAPPDNGRTQIFLKLDLCTFTKKSWPSVDKHLHGIQAVGIHQQMADPLQCWLDRDASGQYSQLSCSDVTEGLCSLGASRWSHRGPWKIHGLLKSVSYSAQTMWGLPTSCGILDIHCWWRLIL